MIVLIREVYSFWPSLSLPITLSNLPRSTLPLKSTTPSEPDISLTSGISQRADGGSLVSLTVSTQTVRFV